MQSQVCPLLGLIDERGSYLTYPSFENRCYAATPHEAIPLNEQTFFCLGGNKERCPRYQARSAAASADARPARSPFAPPLPEESRGGAEIPTEPEPVWAYAAASEETAEPAAADDTGDYDELAEYDWEMPPPPPPAAPGPNGRGAARRPVWPLLLAAGTLVVVLMLCAFVSASWFGIQALSARLALNPTGTPIVERGTLTPGTLPITGTVTSDGLIIVVVTLTPVPPTSAPVALTPTPEPATATPFSTDTPVYFEPTPTEYVPPPVFDTPTVRPTPTPRDTPTPFPTLPTATFTPLPTATVPTVLPSATFEAFVLRFLAEPASIFYGQESTLTWEVRGVRAFFLDGEPMSGPTGSRRVKPLQTTTYVLRVIKTDGSVQEVTQTVTVSQPTPTATPTATPSPTPTPFYAISFAENRSTALIEGTGCQTGNGCAVFQMQVANLGNRPVEYWLEKSPNMPTGWSAFFCFETGCEFSDTTRRRTLNINGLDTVAINFLLPPSVQDGQTGAVNIKGYCSSCGGERYNKDFTIIIDIPPTPMPTSTVTPTATHTPTPTATPTATPTTQAAQSANPDSLAVNAQPSSGNGRAVSSLR